MRNKSFIVLLILVNIVLAFMLIKFNYLAIKLTYITLLLIFSIETIVNDYFGTMSIDNIYWRLFSKK